MIYEGVKATEVTHRIDAIFSLFKDNTRREHGVNRSDIEGWIV